MAGASPYPICPWQGNTVELPEEEKTPEKRVDRIFAMMDKVRPPRISSTDHLGVRLQVGIMTAVMSTGLAGSHPL